MEPEDESFHHNPFIKCPPKIVVSMQTSFENSDQEKPKIISRAQIEDIMGKMIDIGNYSKFSIEEQSTLIQLQRADVRLSSLKREKLNSFAIMRVQGAHQFILHNLYCSYRKRWDLKMCTQVLERITEDLSDQAKKVIEPSKLSNDKQKSKSQDNVEKATILVRIADYYIQFCQINPQLMHSSIVALHSIIVLKDAFKQIYANINRKSQIASCQAQSRFKSNILQRCSRLIHPENTLNKPLMIRAAKHYLSKNMSVIRRSASDDFMCQLSILFQDYSIQSITQSQALTFDQFQSRYMENYSSRGLIEKVLMLAVAYYTLAIQTRSKAMREDDARMREVSEIYHLMAIVVFAANISFPILCLNNLLKTYKTSYGGALQQPQFNLALRSHETEFDQIIFPGFNGKLFFKDKQTIEAEHSFQIVNANKKSSQLQLPMTPYVKSQPNPNWFSASSEQSQMGYLCQKHEPQTKCTENIVDQCKQIQVESLILHEEEKKTVPRRENPPRSRSPKLLTNADKKLKKMQSRLRRRSEFTELCRPDFKGRGSSFSISSKRLKSPSPLNIKFNSLPRICFKTKLSLKKGVNMKKQKSVKSQYYIGRLKKIENPQKRLEQAKSKQRDSCSKLKSLMRKVRTSSPSRRNLNQKKKMKSEKMLLMIPSQSYFGKQESRKAVKPYRKAKLVSEYFT